MRLVDRIVLWFSCRLASRRLSGSTRRLEQLDKARVRSLERLEQRSAELDALAIRIAADVDNAGRIHRSHESALEEVREKNRVLEETINTLVASHRLLLERYDAETAINVRTRVAASATGRE